MLKNTSTQIRPRNHSIIRRHLLNSRLTVTRIISMDTIRTLPHPTSLRAHHRSSISQAAVIRLLVVLRQMPSMDINNRFPSHLRIRTHHISLSLDLLRGLVIRNKYRCKAPFAPLLPRRCNVQLSRGERPSPPRPISHPMNTLGNVMGTKNTTSQEENMVMLLYWAGTLRFSPRDTSVCRPLQDIFPILREPELCITMISFLPTFSIPESSKVHFNLNTLRSLVIATPRPRLRFIWERRAGLARETEPSARGALQEETTMFNMYLALDSTLGLEHSVL